MTKPTPLADRFHAFVRVPDDPDGCWTWTGARVRGYGQFQVRRGTTRRAHRVSWELANGAIPDDLYVLHRCDNRGCVRPDHLFLGDHLDNMRDAVQKGRMTGPRGEAQGRHILTAEQARIIKTSRETGRVLAARYGVSESTVSKIRRGTNWAHVE